MNFSVILMLRWSTNLKFSYQQNVDIDCVLAMHVCPFCIYVSELKVVCEKNAWHMCHITFAFEYTIMHK